MVDSLGGFRPFHLYKSVTKFKTEEFERANLFLKGLNI